MAKNSGKKRRKLTTSRKKSAKHMNEVMRMKNALKRKHPETLLDNGEERCSTSIDVNLTNNDPTKCMETSNELLSTPLASNNDIVQLSSLEDNAEKNITVDINRESEITTNNVSKTLTSSHDFLKKNNILLPPKKTECVDENIPEIPLPSITNFGHVIQISKSSCRLCLSEPTERPTYIWNNENNYKESIYSLCGIVVSECDFLLSLCSHCVGKLNDFDKFRKQCIDNNNIIEKIHRKKQIALSKHNSDIKDELTYDIEFDVLLEYASDSGITSKDVDPEQTEYLFQIDPRDDDSETEIDQQIVFNNAIDYYYALRDQKTLLEGKTIIYECENCPVNCEGKKDIDEHIMSHIEVPKNYDCSVEGCQKKYRSYENVMLHLKKFHNQEVPRRCRKKLCQYCGQLCIGFDHIKAEEGIRRKKQSRSISKKCPVCEKMVTNVSAHILKCHNEDKRRVCHLCSKVFTGWYNLRSHMRTHTGEMPFSCPDCTEVFRHNVTMKFHRLKVHNVNMFKRPPEEVLASISKKPKGKRKKKKGKSTKSADEEQ